MTDMVGTVDGKKFMIAVDAVIIRNGEIFLVKRNNEPHRGKWALPGGRAGMDELLKEAVRREVKEETGFEVEVGNLVGVYDSIDRDPRGRNIAVAYLCEASGEAIESNDEIQETGWFPLDGLPELAFDHADIVRDAISF